MRLVTALSRTTTLLAETPFLRLSVPSLFSVIIDDQRLSAAGKVKVSIFDLVQI